MSMYQQRWSRPPDFCVFYSKVWCVVEYICAESYSSNSSVKLLRLGSSLAVVMVLVL